VIERVQTVNERVQTVTGSRLLLRGSKRYQEGPKCCREGTTLKFSFFVSHIVFAILNLSRRYLDLIQLSYFLLFSGLLFDET
jgi:hypothetical protein